MWPLSFVHRPLSIYGSQSFSKFAQSKRSIFFVKLLLTLSDLVLL